MTSPEFENNRREDLTHDQTMENIHSGNRVGWLGFIGGIAVGSVAGYFGADQLLDDAEYSTKLVLSIVSAVTVGYFGSWAASAPFYNRNR
jgi:hypothetical protein